MRNLNRYVLVFAMLVLQGHQSLAQVPPDLPQALVDANEAYENIVSVEKILRRIENGEDPGAEHFGSDWSKLVDGYRRAGQKLDAASEGDYKDVVLTPVSAEALAKCSSRPAAVEVLRENAKALSSKAAAHKSELRDLDEQKKRIDSNREALKYMIDMTRQAAHVPVIGSTFVWDWYALEAGVRPALGAYDQSVSRYRRKVVRARDRTESQLENLNHNWMMLPACKPNAHPAAGTYVGNKGSSQQHRLVINADGRTGLYVVRNASGYTASDAVRNISINGTSISWMDSAPRSGTISANYKTISHKSCSQCTPAVLKRIN